LQRFAWRWLAASYACLVGGYLLAFAHPGFFSVGLYGPLLLSTVAIGVAIAANRWKPIAFVILLALLQLPISFFFGLDVLCYALKQCV
jgi:hypothetical protein